MTRAGGVPAGPKGWRTALESRLQRLWFAPRGGVDALLIALLWPAHRLVSAIGAARRRRIAQTRALPRPPHTPRVVVVGNLVVGGTGKTPLVVALADALRSRGWRCGVIARGHGGRDAARGVLRVAAADDATRVGDEPLLLAHRTGGPVAAGYDRAAALALLEQAGECDVVLSDDGLQHVPLRRDVELVVFDARGPGNRYCLPAGPLREPLSGALLVDAVVLNGDEARPPLPHSRTFRFAIEPTAFIALRGGRRWAPADFVAELGDRPVDAVAGLGAPQRFFDTLVRLGLRVRRHRLPDHAPIDPAWLARLPSAWIVMTEKDAVRCRGFDDTLLARCVALRIDAVPEPGLIDWLEDRLRG